MGSPYRPPGDAVTQAHLDAFHVVKSIVREMMATTRLVLRPLPRGASVEVVDDARRPLCRISLEEDPGFLELDERSGFHRLEIRRVEDLYVHAERLRRAAWATRRGGRSNL